MNNYYELTNRKIVLSIVLLFTLACHANAQYYEQIQMDSLQRIVDNPRTKDADRIDPLARLSRLYVSQGDSVNATKMLDQARTFAMREKDSKYMIYVYNQELINCIIVQPKKVTHAYQIIDSIYIAIEKTSDSEMQALGYNSIGFAKYYTNLEYDFDDYFKSLSLAEKLPEKSTKKYNIMVSAYFSMVDRYILKDTINAKKYLVLLQQAAEKSMNKNDLCSVLICKLRFDMLHSANDSTLINREFAVLENCISENRDKISSTKYGDALYVLLAAYTLFPNASYLKKLENHTETFKKMANNNPLCKDILLSIEAVLMYAQKNYDESINLLNQKNEFDKTNNTRVIFENYRNLAEIYSETKQYQQAVDALKKALDYQLQSVNSEMDEKHKLAEIKFGVEKQKLLIEQQHSEILIISVSAILVITILILLVWILNRQRKINKLEKEKVQLISQQAMEDNVKIGNKLIINATEMERKDRLIEKAKDMDKEQFSRAIRNEQKKSKLTSDYTKLFHEISPQFYKQLHEQAKPNKLSSNDMKYCAYISLRMNNKELANIMNVEYNTVVSQKYRLKKKLNLSENEDLEKVIIGFIHSS